MSPAEVARVFGVKRIGSGRKWRARCPAHKSRGLTLAIYDDGDKVGVYCHAGCRQDDVLAAVGLTWKDLKPRREQTPEIRERLNDKAKLERLDQRWYIAWLMCSYHSGRFPSPWERMTDIIDIAEIPEVVALMDKRAKPVSLRYWRAVVRRIEAERRELRDKLYPEEKRARELQERIRRVGFEALWEEVYGRNTATESTQ